MTTNDSTAVPLARRRFGASILGRLVLAGIVPASLTAIAVLAVAGLRAFWAIEAAQERVLLEAAEGSADEIEAQNTRLVTLARTLAAVQEQALLGQREKTLELQRQILLDQPEVVGVSFAFEPNADGQDARWKGDPRLAAVTDPNGRFITYCKRDPTAPGGVAYERLVGMEDPDNLWYQEPKRLVTQRGLRVPVITAPYPYEGVDMVEQMHPIVVDGRFLGVVGIDRSLEQIDAALQSAVARIDGDAFLMTRGRFISATTDARIPPARRDRERLQTTEVAASPYAELFRRFEQDPRPSFLERAVDPVLGEVCYYAVTRVPTGDWLLVVREPRSVLLAPVLALVRGNALLAAVGVSVVVLLLVRIARSISRRVAAAAQIAARIAEGDLAAADAASVGADGEDEVAELLRGLASMTDRLNTLLARVREASVRLESTSTEVSAGSRRQSETATGFGASVSQITTASVEIGATGTELLRTMERVAQAASDTATMASAGRRDLGSMASSMQHLKQDAAAVSARLSTIDEKASGITTVVDTITKVADQTNLLSVNAALEAEKAGEFGVGFMVVAREIRRLADQTAEATLDIDRIVRQMQEAVAAGVGEMSRLDARMRSSTEEAARLGLHMGEMIARVDAGSGEVQQVREGMANQAEGANQISQALTGLSSGATSASESAAQFSHAALDLQGALRTLQAALECFRLAEAADDAAPSAGGS